MIWWPVPAGDAVAVLAAFLGGGGRGKDFYHLWNIGLAMVENFVEWV